MALVQLKKIGLVFLVIVSIGVFGYMTLEDLSFLDALYMTVATVAHRRLRRCCPDDQTRQGIHHSTDNIRGRDYILYDNIYHGTCR